MLEVWGGGGGGGALVVSTCSVCSPSLLIHSLQSHPFFYVWIISMTRGVPDFLRIPNPTIQ